MYFGQQNKGMCRQCLNISPSIPVIVCNLGNKNVALTEICIFTIAVYYKAKFTIKQKYFLIDGIIGRVLDY